MVVKDNYLAHFSLFPASSTINALARATVNLATELKWTIFGLVLKFELIFLHLHNCRYIKKLKTKEKYCESYKFQTKSNHQKMKGSFIEK